MDKNPMNGSPGMDTAMLCTADEVLKFDYDHQINNKLWMENLHDIGWGDSDPENMGASKPATCKTNQLQSGSKNVHSERKRRKKLNDTLYTLRSVVPKISKMDKQSIIEDAISYVSDLQKKIREIEGEIEGLCSSNKGDYDTQIKPNYAMEKRFTESCDDKKSGNKLKPGKVLEGKLVEIRNVGTDGIYHVRIECKKDAEVLVDLTRVLESFPVEIINSNTCCFDEAIHYTLYVRSLGNVEADKLEDMIRKIMRRNC